MRSVSIRRLRRSITELKLDERLRLPGLDPRRADLAVAGTILLDTIIVRSVLVTALNLDIGRWMWWPSRLAHKPDPAPHELSQERTAALTRS